MSQGDGKAAPAVNDAIDVTRLNLKVGRVVTATLHPDADGLFVEDSKPLPPIIAGQLQTLCSF